MRKTVVGVFILAVLSVGFATNNKYLLGLSIGMVGVWLLMVLVDLALWWAEWVDRFTDDDEFTPYCDAERNGTHYL
jgi:hypothetical protein